jgi:hypothetical protein
LNDIGFLSAADEINYFGWGAYNKDQPFSIFRNASINYNQWAKWDFGGKLLYTAFNTNSHYWFKNNWMIGEDFHGIHLIFPIMHCEAQQLCANLMVME